MSSRMHKLGEKHEKFHSLVSPRTTDATPKTFLKREVGRVEVILPAVSPFPCLKSQASPPPLSPDSNATVR